MNNVVNQVAYLRTSRDFPVSIGELSVVCSKSYIDVANAVNVRTIGLFPTNRPAITGESWYLVNNQRQQSFRQVYTFTSYTNFNHGINFSGVSTFTKITGIVFDGTIYYPIPYLNPSALVNSIGIRVNPTQVEFLVAGGAPAPQSGFVLLEWLSNV